MRANNLFTFGFLLMAVASMAISGNGCSTSVKAVSSDGAPAADSQADSRGLGTGGDTVPNTGGSSGGAGQSASGGSGGGGVTSDGRTGGMGAGGIGAGGLGAGGVGSGGLKMTGGSAAGGSGVIDGGGGVAGTVCLAVDASIPANPQCHACGSYTCMAGSTLCLTNTPGYGGGTGSRSCATVPAACASTPTCTCICPTPQTGCLGVSAYCSCTETDGFVWVSCSGV
jgi:hypothetical protein